MPTRHEEILAGAVRKFGKNGTDELYMDNHAHHCRWYMANPSYESAPDHAFLQGRAAAHFANLILASQNKPKTEPKTRRFKVIRARRPNPVESIKVRFLDTYNIGT